MCSRITRAIPTMIPPFSQNGIDARNDRRPTIDRNIVHPLVGGADFCFARWTWGVAVGLPPATLFEGGWIPWGRGGGRFGLSCCSLIVPHRLDHRAPQTRISHLKNENSLPPSATPRQRKAFFQKWGGAPHQAAILSFPHCKGKASA